MRWFVLGVRLRWRLTVNRLRKGGTALFVVTLIGCAVLAVSGLSIFISMRGLDADARRNVLVIGLTLLVLGWLFMPLVSGGADETVDPTRLALLPLHRRQLAAVMAGAASSGPAALAVLVSLIGVPVGLARADAGLVVLVVLVPVVYGLGIGIARSGASLLVRAQRSRRGRDLAVLISGLAGVTLWLASQSVGPLLQQDDSRGNAVVDALAWLPPGWAARSALAASDGRIGAAVGWLALTALVAVGALALWAGVTRRLMTASERTAGVDARSDGAPLGGARSALGAAVAKEFRYLRRSPGKRVQFMLGTLMGVGFAVIQMIQNDATDDPKVVFFALWGVLFTMSGSFNVIGFDSGSLWLEVVSGGVRREQLLARSLVWFPVLLVPPTLASFVIGGYTGQWRFVGVALALAATAAGCGIGVGAVVSTIAAVPQTDGDNPFSWRQGMSGRGCMTAGFTFLGLAAVGVIGAPVLLPCLIATDRWWAQVLAVVGIGYGLAVWQAGVSIGARRLARKGPELLAELSPRALT